MADSKPVHEADNGMHVVKLNKHFQIHNAHEVCGFSPEIAKELVDRGHATYVAVREAPKAEPTKPAEVTKFEEKKDEKKFSK